MAPPTTNSKRLKNISISKPIIYGNTAEKISETNPLPPGAPQDHTHTWKVFVADLLQPPKQPTSSSTAGNERINSNVDLSTYVKKVVFKLHDTYNNATRSIEEPPFEVTETGWGEFEIVIKIYFNNDCGEKNITFYHHLKLHPYGASSTTGSGSPVGNGTGTTDDGTHVESILYDEIVFNEPTEKMFKILTTKPSSYFPLKSEVEGKGHDIGTGGLAFTKDLEREEIDRIEKAMIDIRKQIDVKTVEFKALEKERQDLVSQ